MSDDGVIDGYKTTERDREWLGRGIRLGLEAAAERLKKAAEEEERALNNYIKDGGTGPATSYGGVFLAAAAIVSAITPADVLKGGS